LLLSSWRIFLSLDLNSRGPPTRRFFSMYTPRVFLSCELSDVYKPFRPPLPFSPDALPCLSRSHNVFCKDNLRFSSFWLQLARLDTYCGVFRYVILLFCETSVFAIVLHFDPEIPPDPCFPYSVASKPLPISPPLFLESLFPESPPGFQTSFDPDCYHSGGSQFFRFQV